MNGGILVQDCSNHAIGYTHEITDGRNNYDITSTHHQMQYPYNIPDDNYDVIFTSYPTRSRYYEGDKINESIIVRKGEPEIVLYHTPNLPKCLAIQGHPEMMRKDAPVVKMLNKLLNDVCQK